MDLIHTLIGITIRLQRSLLPMIMIMETSTRMGKGMKGDGAGEDSYLEEDKGGGGKES